MPTPPDSPRLIDDRPVLFEVVPTVEEAGVFPERLVRQLAPAGSRHVVAVVLGVLIGLCAAASFGYGGLHERSPDLPAATPVVAVALGVVLAVVNWKRGSWIAYAGAVVVGAVVMLATGSGAAPLLLAVVVLAAGGVAAWRGERARIRRWTALRPLLDRHEADAGTITGIRQVGFGGANEQHLWVTVAGTRHPELSWAFRDMTRPWFQPQVGDPVSVWFSPDDPACAVLLAAQPLVGPGAPRSA